MAKTKQVKYEEAVERNLRNAAHRTKFKSLEDAKRILGIRERDTKHDEAIRQYVEA